MLSSINPGDQPAQSFTLKLDKFQIAQYPANSANRSQLEGALKTQICEMDLQGAACSQISITGLSSGSQKVQNFIYFIYCNFDKEVSLLISPLKVDQVSLPEVL